VRVENSNPPKWPWWVWLAVTHASAARRDVIRNLCVMTALGAVAGIAAVGMAILGGVA
jgi:hypothetical protein